MKYVVLAMGVLIGMPTGGTAQMNGGAPAELPPLGFEGREFTDSQGCVFLRSTFGGEVTWLPRYGPDRRPICGETPTAEATVGETTQAATPAAEPAAPVAAAPVISAPVAAAPVAAPSRPAAAPAPRAQPRRAAPQPARTQRALPRANASGRHPSCPASAPYGQLVDTALGRPLVRCVTSPALFLDEYFNGGPRSQGAPIALPGGAKQVAHAAPSAHARGGRLVQVGSFGVASNATRLRARLQHAGLPARIHQTRGLNVVTVGPFTSADRAHHALASVRRMGFRDAFLR